jgi:hypothetical protein
MSDRSVVEIYRAENGYQAQRFARALEEAGIKAEIQGTILHPAAETAANLLTGVTPWWDAPRILVFAENAERAKQLLLELEERERNEVAVREGGPGIEVVCEKCGQRSTYPGAQRGSVQDCQHCGAYVDVESAGG